MAKKRRSAAQRAATARMIAANRRRGRGKAKRKPNPSRAARRPAQGYTVGSTKRHRIRRRKMNPTRYARRRRRNPTGIVGEFMSMAVPSAIGGAGALGLDVLMGMLPLPDTFKTGAARPVARVAGSVGLGFAAGKVFGRRVGNQLAAGALTVVLYDLMKGIAAKALGGKVPGLGVYEIPGIGMYEVSPQELVPAPDGMGYYDAGLQVGNGVGEYVQ